MDRPHARTMTTAAQLVFSISAVLEERDTVWAVLHLHLCACPTSAPLQEDVSVSFALDADSSVAQEVTGYGMGLR
jgi:hypothetical protein